MTELIEILYNHAAERNFHPYLPIQARNAYFRAWERTETSLRQFLPQDQAKLLDALRQTWTETTSIEMEAAFQSGLALGLELSRL